MMNGRNPRGNPDQDGKVVRPCIICQADDSRPVFVYDYNFMTQVKGMSPETIQLRWGWDKDTTSTIVQCNKCGCMYIRDVVIPLEAPPIDIDDYVARRASIETPKIFQARDFEFWVARYLIAIAHREQKRNIKFLDFGAGATEVSSMARCLGVKDVFAYGPFYPPDVSERFARTNMPGIQYIRTLQDVYDNGPYDAAFFQVAIEHCLDPAAEMDTLFNTLSPGGILYVCSPFMDLKNELSALKAVKKIEKKNAISHYHVGHYNYMTPKEFEKLAIRAGFEISPIAPFYPPPPDLNFFKQIIIQKAKFLIRTIQNIFGIPYGRRLYILRKPY